MHNIYELRSRTDKLIQNLSDMEKVLDFADLSCQLSELELKAADPHIWDDPQLAQSTTSQLSRVQAQLEKYAQLKNQLNDIPLLLEMVEEEAESEKEVVCEQISAQLNEMFDTITQWETQTLLSGEYDPREALVTIRSGAGGVDAADWTQMLFRMYSRWAEQHGYPVEVYDISYAEEAGIKSATVGFKFPYAYGMLSVEMGTHRLVRISPFDNQGRRHTSFAEVEVLPVVENVDHIDIAESDIRVDVFRSSGPGGQSVNTTDSAVRITHIPTGIVVSCQNEKSQLQNKASAMKVLSSRLLELRRQEERKNLESLKKDGGTSWGNQMRSYVLHPYQMVKDLRTDYEVGNPSAVLDGDLDEFISRAIHERARICQNS